MKAPALLAAGQACKPVARQPRAALTRRKHAKAKGGMSRCARRMRRRTKKKAGRTAGQRVAAIVPALRPTAIRLTDRRERRASGPRGRGSHRIGAARLHRDPLSQQRRDGEGHARAHPRPLA